MEMSQFHPQQHLQAATNLTVTDTFTLPSGDTNSRALKPTAGSLRFNQDFATLEFYTGNNWATGKYIY